MNAMDHCANSRSATGPRIVIALKDLDEGSGMVEAHSGDADGVVCSSLDQSASLLVTNGSFAALA
jgi:hypothetical protein